MSYEPPSAEPHDDLTPPARLSWGAAQGCLGIACILATLPLLWLAIGAGRSWQERILPLVAFGAAAIGLRLTLQVPSSAPRRRDPYQPLTRLGVAPEVERPAQPRNRIAWLASGTVLVLSAAGYLLEAVNPGHQPAWGLLMTLIGGAALIAAAVAVGMGAIPPPALRWLRLTHYGAPRRQTGALAALGAIAIASACYLALLDGYAWGVIGLATLVLALVALAPAGRRIPTGERRLRRQTPD